MLDKIQCLEQRVERLEGEKVALNERDGHFVQILHSLRAGKHIVEILDRLHREDSYGNIAEWLGTLSVAPAIGSALRWTPDTRLSEAQKRDLVAKHGQHFMTWWQEKCEAGQPPGSDEGHSRRGSTSQPTRLGIGFLLNS